MRWPAPWRKRGGVGSLRQKLFGKGVGGSGEMCCGTGDFVEILAEIVEMIWATNSLATQEISFTLFFEMYCAATLFIIIIFVIIMLIIIVVIIIIVTVAKGEQVLVVNLVVPQGINGCNQGEQ